MQWLVHVEGERAYLVPANGWVTSIKQTGSAPPPTQPWLGPAPIDDNLGAWLQERLGRIARVQNLLQMAGSSGVADPQGSSINIEAELVRYDLGSPRRAEAVKWANGRTVLAEI